MKYQKSDHAHVTIYTDNLLEGDSGKKEEAIEEVLLTLTKLGYTATILSQCPFSILFKGLGCASLANILLQSRGNRAFWIDINMVEQCLSYNYPGTKVDSKIIIFKKGSKFKFIPLADIPKFCHTLAHVYVVEEHLTYSLSAIDRYPATIVGDG